MNKITTKEGLIRQNSAKNQNFEFLDFLQARFFVLKYLKYRSFGRNRHFSAKMAVTWSKMTIQNEFKISLTQLERQYARLKSLIYDRREKLEELVVLTEFRRFLDELERWIREKEIIASSEDTGN